MEVILKNAANGRRKAMHTLYDGELQKLYYTAYCLLEEENAAVRTVILKYSPINK